MRERAVAYVPLALESLHLQPPAKLIQRPPTRVVLHPNVIESSGPRLKAHSAHGRSGAQQPGRIGPEDARLEGLTVSRCVDCLCHLLLCI